MDAERIDLGNEPPLSVDGETNEFVDRRRVSVQWFSGTILTGLCGAALMGGAVFASLDGETNFATVPERVELSLRGAVVGGDRTAGSTRKADRLPPVVEANSLRRVIPVTTTSRGANNREILRVRPFVRVAGNLSLSVSELSANIPPFNPQKTMLADAGAAGAPGAEDAPDTEADAEPHRSSPDHHYRSARHEPVQHPGQADVPMRIGLEKVQTGADCEPRHKTGDCPFERTEELF
jgi:hypothetical protein